MKFQIEKIDISLISMRVNDVLSDDIHYRKRYIGDYCQNPEWAWRRSSIKYDIESSIVDFEIYEKASLMNMAVAEAAYQVYGLEWW
jgi:hypothetical protein